MPDYYNNMIHKVDRKGKLMSIKDMTNDEWDIGSYNNYRLEFVEYGDNNKAQRIIPFFMDADELTGILGQITSGNYTKVFDDWENFYAGSKNQGQGRKNVDGNMVPIVEGTESRRMSIGLNDQGYFVFKVSVGPGKVGSTGAIKPAGDTAYSISFGITTQEVAIMAKAIETYTIAKKVIGVSNYMRNKKKEQPKGE